MVPRVMAAVMVTLLVVAAAASVRAQCVSPSAADRVTALPDAAPLAECHYAGQVVTDVST